ncbi:hypothetical protein YC2023_009647 [Brassica napus]|uniref:Uncharacterized protein n=1 Tax=Brassica oleracea TaxID=3712 RepID=Q2A9F4_BRAOL|nr:hypothetical protein 31.t00004 [Brassica oleracea]
MAMTSLILHRRSKNETVAISSKHHSLTLDCLHIAIGLALLRHRHLSFSTQPAVCCVVSSFASSALSVVLCLRRDNVHPRPPQLSSPCLSDRKLNNNNGQVDGMW